MRREIDDDRPLEQDAPPDDEEDLYPEHPFFSGATTPSGRWSVALSAVSLAWLLVLNVLFYSRVMGSEAGDPAWLLWVAWGPVTLTGAAGALVGIASLMRGDERSRLVYLASSLCATLAFIGGTQLV